MNTIVSRTIRELSSMLLPAATFLFMSFGARAATCAWEPHTSPGSPSLAHHDMAYDSMRSNLVLVGTDMTAWPRTNWFVYHANTGLTWTSGGELPDGIGNDPETAFDASRGVTVVYTGTNVVWEYDGTSWSRKTASTVPVCCPDGALLKYDPSLQKVMLVGSAGYPGDTVPSETWLWDGTDWARAADATHSPTGAAGGAMAYDAERGRMTLVTMTGMQTWTFDGASWTQHNPATTPTPSVWVFNMAYAPDVKKIILYGGEGGGGVYPTNTWAWDGADWSVLDSTVNPGGNIDFAFTWFPPMQALVMHGGWCDSTGWQPSSNVWLCRFSQEEQYITNAPVPVPVSWLASYGITNQLEAANTNDLDADGAATWREYVMDTNPTNRESRLVFLPSTTVAPDGNILTWSASPERLYDIRWGTNLLGGITNFLVQELHPAGYGSMSYTDTVHHAELSVFYRVGVNLP